MQAPAVRSTELAYAAYGVALRITQDADRALASMNAAAPGTPGDSAAAFLRRVRHAARLRRGTAPDPATAPRPPAFADVAYAEWSVLERVALRGMSITEAGAAVGVDRREALRRLHRGMLAAGGCLSGSRRAGGATPCVAS